MTATQAQAASSPAAAEHDTSADATHADTATTGTGAGAQQDAHLTSTVAEQPSAALSHGESCGVFTADPDADSGGGWEDNNDTLVGTEGLIIEDAAKLTCDRAAAILRQLSCECDAAKSCHSLEAACSTSVAEQEQQTHVPLNQAEADHPVAVCRTESAVAAVTAGIPLSPETLLDNAESVAERAGQVPAPQGQPSTSGSAVDAAGVKGDSGIGWPVPDSQSSGSIDTSSACLNTSSLQAGTGSDASQDAACPSMQPRSDQSAASSMQAASQQGTPISSFLRRLQMSQHLDVSGSHAASHQSEERTAGEQLNGCCCLCQS